MKRSRAKGAALLGAALCAAGCVMSSSPTGPVGMASKTVSTVAGQTGVLGSNAPGASVAPSAADFYYPAGMVYLASTNSIYIADSGNCTIRQWNLTTQQVTTFAGYPGVAGYFDNLTSPTLSAYFNNPEGITTDGTYLYVADSGNNVIRRVNLSTYLVDTLAGSTNASSGWINATGASALFNNPLSICYATVGASATPTLYVADSGNYAIRQITNLQGSTETGIVTTIAGSPFSTIFYWPQGVAFDSTNGSLYAVDSGYDEVFQVSTGGVVTALAGSGAKGDADGTGSAAQFNWPEGIATDNTNLYIADTLNSTIRQVVISTGAVTTLAGQGQVTGSANGPGNVATFNHPMRVLVNGSIIYVSDTYNETIRKIQ